MRSGPRHFKITIQAFTKTGEDDFGADILDWTTYAQPFAEIIFGTGAERRDAAQESASAPATFRVLDTSLTRAVTTEHRISFDGGTWDIISNVASTKLRRHREITAVRSAA